MIYTPLRVNVFVHSPHRNIWNTNVKLFLEHFVQISWGTGVPQGWRGEEAVPGFSLRKEADRVFPWELFKILCIHFFSLTSLYIQILIVPQMYS
jgi:hypothetical protein